MASFDIVSEINFQEVDNAVNQAKKEIEGRYDFRGSKARIDWDKKELAIVGEDEYKLNAMKDILLKRMHHRGLDIKALQFEKAEPLGGMLHKQKITIIQGIDKEKAKQISKDVRDSKIKVQVQIEGEKLRVSSKSIDCLQECMAFLRKNDYGLPLQFTNMRS